MAKILCVWELGSNLGHLSNLKVFVDIAREQGHEVVLACKEIHNVSVIFSDEIPPLYQSPYLWRKAPSRSHSLGSYAELVATRFQNLVELTTLCNVWENIFNATQPDVVIYDHAPSALIASLHSPWKKWIIGSAFLIPDLRLPYFGLFPDVKNTPENHQRLKKADKKLLAMVNSYLESKQRPHINNVRRIFSQADCQLLMTLPELDLHGKRKESGKLKYLGIDTTARGKRPLWPKRGRYRIFGYLSQFPAREALLQKLNSEDFSVVIYSRDLPLDIQKRYSNIVFSSVPLDMNVVAKEADLVITMANHTTCAHCLFTGVAQLLIPGHQEQSFMARRIIKLGRGVKMSNREKDVSRAFSEALALAKKDKTPMPADKVRDMSGSFLFEKVNQLIDSL